MMLCQFKMILVVAAIFFTLIGPMMYFSGWIYGLGVLFYGIALFTIALVLDLVDLFGKWVDRDKLFWTWLGAFLVVGLSSITVYALVDTEERRIFSDELALFALIFWILIGLIYVVTGPKFNRRHE